MTIYFCNIEFCTNSSSFYVSDPPPIDETKGTCQVNICLILAYVLHTYACLFSTKVNTNELFNGTKLDTKRCNG
jgi:hypothetical protein